ncbi:MAG: hypothetical protein HQL38_00475 [Alphaproteobacteria bacterium]|nr:hypothetical protein [Alphaproteobacteria bacterium]
MPLLLTELALSSWETIAHRSAMMASGACSDREYRRMVEEKMRAARQSGAALMTGATGAALLMGALRPWHAGATRNARRLRKRKPVAVRPARPR